MGRFQCFFILASAMFPIGCNQPGLTSSETNAILTIFDQDFNYGRPRTYALSSEVGDLCLTASEVGEGGASGEAGASGEGGDSDPRFDSSRCTRHGSSLDDDVLEVIANGMDDLGYDRVKSPDDADVIVMASAVTRSQWYYSSGFEICDDLLGKEECWSPDVSYSFVLPYGSLLVTWIDGRALSKGDVESAWLATIPGVYGSYAPRGNVASVQAALSQAFLQSPYLGGAK